MAGHRASIGETQISCGMGGLRAERHSAAQRVYAQGSDQRWMTAGLSGILAYFFLCLGIVWLHVEEFTPCLSVLRRDFAKSYPAQKGIF